MRVLGQFLSPVRWYKGPNKNQIRRVNNRIRNTLANPASKTPYAVTHVLHHYLHANGSFEGLSPRNCQQALIQLFKFHGKSPTRRLEDYIDSIPNNWSISKVHEETRVPWMAAQLINELAKNVDECFTFHKKEGGSGFSDSVMTRSRCAEAMYVVGRLSSPESPLSKIPDFDTASWVFRSRFREKFKSNISVFSARDLVLALEGEWYSGDLENSLYERILMEIQANKLTQLSVSGLARVLYISWDSSKKSGESLSTKLDLDAIFEHIGRNITHCSVSDISKILWVMRDVQYDGLPEESLTLMAQVANKKSHRFLRHNFDSFQKELARMLLCFHEYDDAIDTTGQWNAVHKHMQYFREDTMAFIREAMEVLLRSEIGSKNICPSAKSIATTLQME